MVNDISPDVKVLNTRNKGLKLGTWNVQTLNKDGRFDNLIMEASNMNLDILGICETRWKGVGYIDKEEHIFIYSGGEKRERGVGILIKKEIEKHVAGYWTYSDRIMLIKIKATPFDLAIVQTYAPTTDHNDEEIEEYYENLQEVLKHVGTTDILIVMGDMNAKVGKGSYEKIVGNFGLGKRNDRGDRLIQFCVENNLIVCNTFFQHHPRKLYTWTSPADIVRNQIDFVMIKDRFKNNVKSAKTYPGADIGKVDHNPVVIRLDIKLKRIGRKVNNIQQLDITALKQPDIQKTYCIEVKNKFECLTTESLEQYRRENPQEKVESQWNNFKVSIQEANKNLPKKEKRQDKDWMTQEILNKMKVRKSAKNKPEYKIIHKEIRTMCREAKVLWLESKCKNIEQLGKNNSTHLLHKEIKTLTKSKDQPNKGGCIKNKNGRILIEKEQITNRWTEYVTELFEDNNRNNNPTLFNNEGPKILKYEIAHAITSLKKGKAVGLDQISLEMIEALEEFGIEAVTAMCNEIYDTGHIPYDLKTSIFITLPKKPGAVECSDHRTISLMSHVTKILLKVIQERTKWKIDREISEDQFGFRPFNGTREAIFCIRQIIEKYIEVQKDIYVCFIDYKKAFDSINHVTLIESLQEIGIDGKDIRLIRNLYWEQLATVRSNNEYTPFIDIKKGVRQGCILSPSLFNNYTEKLFRVIKNMPGLNIHGRNINNIRYADDTVVLAESELELQELITTLNSISQDFGLEINIQKTKTMVISKTEKQHNVAVKINNVTLEQVKSYVYLGHTITEDGRCEVEIKKRIGMAKNTFNKMKHLLTSKQINNKLKMRIIKCYVFSTLLYASETWTMNKQLEGRITAFEMWIYRRIGGISWKQKVTNIDVLKRLGMKKELLGEIKSRQARYFGHIKRHNTILKTVLEGRVDGTRAQGGQRYRWVDNIKRWTARRLSVCTTVARNRDNWRGIVANLRCGEGT
jgi:hypothetical protein